MTTLTQAQISAMRAAAPLLQNGTYTVSHPATQKHYTVKVYTKDFAKPGETPDPKRVIALLTGPNNQTDFRGVAFWDEDQRRAFVWKRYGSTANKREWPLDGSHWPKAYNKIERKITVFLSLAVQAPLQGERGDRGRTYWEQEGYELLCEGRCLVCNRPLTDPSSIELGIGPTCAERITGGGAA